MGQTVLIRCEVWADKRTDQQPAYVQPPPFISLVLCFPMFVLPQTTWIPPFPFLFSPSSKHPIISLVQFQMFFPYMP